MKVKIIVTPIDKNGGPAGSDTRWRCIFQQIDNRKGSPTFGKRMWFWLTENGTVFNENKSVVGAAGSLLVINRGEAKEIELDDDDPDFDNMIWFWKYGKHSQPRGENNPNLVIPYFDVVVDVDIFRIQYETIEEKFNVAGRLRDMTPEDLRDTAFAIGTNPEGLTRNSLLATLIGPTFSGDAMLKKAKNEKGIEMLAVNAYRSRPKERREMIATVHKAIKYHLLEEKDGTLTGGGKNVGETPEKAVVYCENNQEYYINFIQRGVREYERDNFSMTDFDDREEFNKSVYNDMKVSEHRLERQEEKAAKKPAVSMPVDPVDPDDEDPHEPATVGPEPQTEAPKTSRPIPSLDRKAVPPPPKRN